MTFVAILQPQELNAPILSPTFPFCQYGGKIATKHEKLPKYELQNFTNFRFRALVWFRVS